MMDNECKEEYRSKWAYILHIESERSKYVQWYFAIVAGVIAVMFSGHQETVEDLIGAKYVPFLFLVLYSLLVELRLVLQKANYDVYMTRVRELEGQKPIPSRGLFSVFNLQYYPIIFAGSGLLLGTCVYARLSLCCTIILVVLYALGSFYLPFSKLAYRKDLAGC